MSVPTSNDASKGKKRKKWMYAKSGGGTKRARSWWRQLDVGMKGFLITCNNKERETINEAYDLLTEYADQLYGPEQEAGKETQETGEESEEDIEAALKKEVDSLKKKKAKDKRFQVVESGAKNCVFIQTTIEDPSLLAHNVLSDLYETETSKSRYIMRILPVIGTCKANEERISKVAMELLEPFFENGQRVSYCFNFKIRNNNTISRTTLLPVLGHTMETLNPNLFVNMTDPDFTISLDILRSVCCFSCVRDFNKFRKYNMQEVVHAKQSVKASSVNDKKTDIQDTNTGTVTQELSALQGSQVKQQDESLQDSIGPEESDMVTSTKETVKKEAGIKADTTSDGETGQDVRTESDISTSRSQLDEKTDSETMTGDPVKAEICEERNTNNAENTSRPEEGTQSQILTTSLET